MFTSGGAAAAVGDYDSDGFEDIFVTDSDAGKPNHLFHNNGNLTFTDVAEKAGVAGGNDPLSVVSDALWFDYDNDGKLGSARRALRHADPLSQRRQRKIQGCHRHLRAEQIRQYASP